MLKRAFRYAVKRIIGLQSPEAIWRQYQTTRNPFLKDRLRSWLETNESRLPESIREPFARGKWASDWFFETWFLRAPAVDTLEARHRALRQVQKVCAAHPEIVAFDELGSATGSFTRQATLVLPHLGKFRGWEISPRAAEALRDRYADDPKLEFHQTDIDALISSPGPSVIVTVGTLQYMSQSELASFLRRLKDADGLHTLVLAEITAFGLDCRPHSELRRHQAYSHSYMQLLKDAGFTVTAAENFAFKPDVPWIIVSASSR